MRMHRICGMRHSPNGGECRDKKCMEKKTTTRKRNWCACIPMEFVVEWFAQQQKTENAWPISHDVTDSRHTHQVSVSVLCVCERETHRKNSNTFVIGPTQWIKWQMHLLFFCFVCASFSGSFFFWMLVYSEIDRHETKRAPPIVVHLLHRWWSNWQSCSLCASHLYQFYIFRMLCTRYHSEREKERDSDVRAHTNIDQIKVHNRMTLNFCCIFFFSIYDTKNACAMMLRKFICPMDGVCVCAIRITF